MTRYQGGDDEKPDRYNVAGDRDLLNIEVVEMAAEVLGLKPRIRYEEFHQSRPGHDLRYSLDGTKLREAGWKPPSPSRSPSPNVCGGWPTTPNGCSDLWLKEVVNLTTRPRIKPSDRS